MTELYLSSSPGHEYQQCYPVPGDATHGGLWAFELIGIINCWQSSFVYASAAMAAHAGLAMLIHIIQMASEPQIITLNTKLQIRPTPQKSYAL